jgi:leader peptidase (prepilin peptidase)/N-methyltransferase
MIFGKFSLFEIIAIQALGACLSMACFFAYMAICQYINTGKLKSNWSVLQLTNNRTALCVVFVISIVVINILFYKYSYSLKLIALCVFLYLMLLLAAIDCKTQILPDIITKPLIFLGVLQGFLGILTNLQSAVLGAILGYLVFWLINSCFKLARGIDGMGQGDFKLLCAIGAWAGFQMLPLVILLSSVLGVFVALCIIKFTKISAKTPTPFGPTLVFAGSVAILYGNDIMLWYWACIK